MAFSLFGKPFPPNRAAKAHDQEGLLESTQAMRQLSQAVTAGIAGTGAFCGRLAEPIPGFIEAECETINFGAGENSWQSNTWIILGRDRPGSRLTGYGGNGETQAGMIDIVCGRGGHDPNAEEEVDPSFVLDAARVYVSQKTDVDRNFELVAGSVGSKSSKYKSAVAMKADGIRLIAREGIKLVTLSEEANSRGQVPESIKGIDLIAGNDDRDLQPLVKGNNLVECLKSMMEHIDELNAQVESLARENLKHATAIALHVHPFHGTPGTNIGVSAGQIVRSASTMLNTWIHKVNNFTVTTRYLEPFVDGYILSRHNHTN